MSISQKDENANKDATEKEKEKEKETSCHALVDALVCLCSGTNLTEEDTHLIALATVVCAHHPVFSKYMHTATRY